MAVPDFQSLMLPLLKFSADDEEHTMQEAREGLAKIMGLSEEDLQERLPSGRQSTFANRVAWAKVYLTQAGVLESPKRGKFHISDRGRKILSENPERIDIKFCSGLRSFRHSGRQVAKEKRGQIYFSDWCPGDESVPGLRIECIRGGRSRSGAKK